MATAAFCVGEIRSASARPFHRHWGLFLFEGIVLIILGTLAVLVPAVASVPPQLYSDGSCFAERVIGLIATFRAQDPGIRLVAVSAILGIVAGVILLATPLQGTLVADRGADRFPIGKACRPLLFALEQSQGASGRWSWLLGQRHPDDHRTANYLTGRFAAWRHDRVGHCAEQQSALTLV